MENRTQVEKPSCAHLAPKVNSGSCGHHHAETVTALLSDEHRVIERVLVGLEQLTSRPIKGSFESWKKALDFIRHFADQCHHYKEEKVLFPAMEEHGIPSDGGPVGMMLIEHEEGRSYVRGMAAALAQIEEGDSSAANALFENAKNYLRLLREHIQKEDDILFPMADQALGAAEQQRMLMAFAEHEASEMGAGVHEKYLSIAEELASAANG